MKSIKIYFFKSINLLLKLTEWIPKYSGKDGFKKGMIKTINWFTKNMDNLDYKNKDYII